MKRLLSVILSVAMLLCVVPLGAIPVSAAEPSSGTTGDCTWTLVDNHLTISGNGAMGAGSPWGNADSIQTITIEEGVTSIGAGAFENFSRLYSVEMGNSVTTIETGAFRGSSWLEVITLGDGVTTIGDYAFEGCADLSLVTLSAGVTTVGVGAFASCEYLDRVVYYGDTDSKAAMQVGAENDPFLNAEWHYFDYSCDEVCNECGVTRPISGHVYDDKYDDDCNQCGAYWYSATSGVTGECTWTLDGHHLTISGTGAMGYHGDLVSKTLAPWGDRIFSVTIEEGVTTIGDGSFCGCEYLTEVTIAESVTSIGWGAFSGCDSLSTIVIPDGVTTIAEYAFSGCDQLTTVQLGDNVAYLGYLMFSQCKNLTSITIPATMSYIDTAAFHGCDNLTDVYYGGSESDLEMMTIEDGNEALQNATWQYNWPRHTYDDVCDADCNVCGKVRVPPHSYDSDAVCVVCGLFYTASGVTGDCTWVMNGFHLTISGTGAMGDYTTYVSDNQAPWGDRITSVTIEEGVTKIGKGAFCNCADLTEVNIPDSVTSIGTFAFVDCESLTSITFPPNVTSLGDHVFAGCDQLTTVDLGRSLTYISTFAFGSCKNLTTITMPATVRSIESYAFHDCQNLAEVHFGGDAREESLEMSLWQDGNEPLRQAQWTYVICDHVYDNSCDADCNLCGKERDPNHSYDTDGVCRNCGYVQTASGYTGSCRWTLNGSHLTISGNGKMEDYHHYYDGEEAPWFNVRTVTIEEGVTHIGDFAFHQRSIVSITIPSTVTSIGAFAFYECWNLDDVYYSGLPSDRDAMSIGTDFNDASSRVFKATWHYHWGVDHVYDDVCDAYCNTCDEERVPPHAYDAVTIAPDCVNGGYTTYTCSLCGYSCVGDETAALGHTYDTVCDDDCNVCGEYRNPPHGEIYKDYNCNIYCSECDVFLGYQHLDFDHIKAVIPTCTKGGNVEYWCCYDCGQLWWDEGLNEIGNWEEVDLPALGHVYDNGCDVNCNGCGKYRPNPPHGELYEEQCSIYCADCDTFLRYEHTDICHVEAVSPTCIAQGNVEYWYCNGCGHAWLDEGLTQRVNVKNVILPAIGHNYDNSTTCNNCGVSATPGDANGDGSVSVVDVALMQRYLSGWEISMDEAAADADGDGRVTLVDVALLQRYLSGWDVTLGKQ